MSLLDWLFPKPRRETQADALARIAAVNGFSSGTCGQEPAASYRPAPAGVDPHEHWTTHPDDVAQLREDWRQFHEQAERGRRERPWLAPELRDMIDGEWK